MSEIIRDAVIRLRIEQQKAKLEAPQIADMPRAYQEQQKAVKESAVLVQEHARYVKESTETHKTFAIEAGKSFRHAAEGTIQFARGFALMTASGEEDTRKLLEAFAKIEAATAMARGAMNLSKFALSFGATGGAAAVALAGIAALTLAWKRHTEQLEEVRRKTLETRKATEALGRAAQESSDKLASISGSRGIGFALSPEYQQDRIQKELDRLRKQRFGIEDEIIAAGRGPTNLERDKSLRQRQFENANSQAELLREQWRSHDELLTKVREGLDGQREGVTGLGAFAGVPGLGPAAVAGATVAFNAQQQGLSSRQQQVLDNFQSFIDMFVGIMKVAQEKLAEIDAEQRRQAAANPK